jgi:biopolymer transport protein ExbD
MPFHRSIRTRKGRKRFKMLAELQLTAMRDVMVIILVFLLKSYATSTNTFTTVEGLKLPISISPDMPPDSLQVIVTPESITFEDQKVVEFVQNAADLGSSEASYQFKKSDLDPSEPNQIVPLFGALEKAREKAELLRAKSKARDEEGKPLPFEGVLAIQADKRVNYDTIRKIMYTAATAQYRTFRFLAQKKEE